MQGYVKILLLSAILTTAACQSTEEVTMVVEITRHGARAPFHIKGVEVEWMKGLQQSDLTPVGHRQHYLLGKQMAQTYSNIFTGKLNHDEYYVRSSEFQRTGTSAISHLMGLWDHFNPKQLDFDNGDSRIEPPYINTTDVTFRTPLPNGFIVSPIHTETTDEDSMLYFMTGGQCPKAAQESHAFRLKIGSDLEKNQDALNLLKGVCTKFGMKYEDYKNKFELCYEIGDFVAMDLKHNNDPIIKKDDPGYGLLMRCYESNIVGKYSKPEILKVVSSALMTDIMKKINEKVEKNSKSKYYLFAAHDSTLSPLLIMAGVLDPMCFVNDMLNNRMSDCKNYPDTAANVVFELVKFNDDHFIRMLSNFEPIDFCDLKNTNDRFRCPLKQFENKWTSLVSSNWQEWCGTTSKVKEYFKENKAPWKSFALLMIGITAAVALLYIVLVVYLMRKQRQSQSAKYDRQEILEEDKSFGA